MLGRFRCVVRCPYGQRRFSNSVKTRSWRSLLIPAVSLGCGFALGLQCRPVSPESVPDSDIVRTAGDYGVMIESLPAYKSLLADLPSMHLLNPHSLIPDYLRKRHLLAGTLSGPNMLLTPPRVYVDERRAQLVGFYSLGDGLAGHHKVVHGGLLAAILDEVLAFTAIPQLPGRLYALTSYLNIRYISKVRTDSTVMIHTETVGFRGEYDRKVVIRAVLVNAGSVGSTVNLIQDAEAHHEHETFPQYQKRMIKKFGYSNLHCVAEAEFVVPRKHAFWLYWLDWLRPLQFWRPSIPNSQHRYRIPFEALKKANKTPAAAPV